MTDISDSVSATPIAPEPNARPTKRFFVGFVAKNRAEVPPRKLTTEELAAFLRVVPQTVRAGLCRNGHYLGLRPLKLPNGKLLWNFADVDQLLSGEVAA